MDFILGDFTLTDEVLERCKKLRSDYRTDEIKLVKTKNFNTILFGNNVVESNDAIGFWEGQFSIDDKFFHYQLKENPSIEKLYTLSQGNAVANGIFCALHIDLTKSEFTLSRDSLSHYPIHIIKMVMSTFCQII